MNRDVQLEGSNVIQVQFGAEKDVFQEQAILQERLPELDPLTDVLGEFEDLSEIDLNELSLNEKLDKKECEVKYQVNFQDDLTQMSDTVLSQVQCMSENISRLKYYLDELNIE